MQGQLHVHPHGGHALGMQAQIVGHIEDAFKKNTGNKWEAWWKAVCNYEREMHDITDESPDEEDEEWDDFWKRKKTYKIESAIERLGVDPSVHALMRDALSHYQDLWAYPNWS